MNQIFAQLFYEMEKHRDTVLVTLIDAAGSAPRKSGSQMLVGADGRLTGTIGGGAVERRSEEMAMALLREKRSAVHDFLLHTAASGGDIRKLYMIFNTSINCFKESVQIIRDSCFTRRCRTISSSILETSIEERFKRFEYINSIIILSDVQIYCDYLSNISASSFISTLMINYQINLMRSSGNQIFSKFRS